MTVPGLAEDLAETYAAWQRGKLRRTHGQLFYTLRDGGLVVLGLGVIAGGAWLATRRRLR